MVKASEAAIAVVFLMGNALWSHAFTPSFKTLSRPALFGSENKDEDFMNRRQVEEHEDGKEFIRKPITSVDTSLWPPAFNLRKESILFGENPATQRDNNVSRLWRFCKQQLPDVVTGGAYRTTSNQTCDDNPIGGLYNMLLVRIPCITAGLVYSKNVIEGHPLIVDVGSGPFEMNPLIVFGVLYYILR
jgi:hypothetical protein